MAAKALKGSPHCLSLNPLGSEPGANASWAKAQAHSTNEHKKKIVIFLLIVPSSKLPAFELFIGHTIKIDRFTLIVNRVHTAAQIYFNDRVGSHGSRVIRHILQCAGYFSTRGF